jgi:multidrug efflux pump subunit AcrA (membrane-fusion protein)
MVPVEIAISGQSARRLKPGFMARVTFRFAERPGVIFAPSSAVVGTGEARAVFVVEGGKAQRRPVRLGQESGEKVEIIDGLAVGETIVAVGAADLRDGASVRVVAPAGSTEASAKLEKPDEASR